MEVILILDYFCNESRCILHVCGGDPLGFDDSWAKKAVFSTYVEVILETPKETISLVSILHVCGGDPWLMRKLMN